MYHDSFIENIKTNTNCSLILLGFVFPDMQFFKYLRFISRVERSCGTFAASDRSADTKMLIGIWTDDVC